MFVPGKVPTILSAPRSGNGRWRQEYKMSSRPVSKNKNKKCKIFNHALSVNSCKLVCPQILVELPLNTLKCLYNCENDTTLGFYLLFKSMRP